MSTELRAGQEWVEIPPELIQVGWIAVLQLEFAMVQRSTDNGETWVRCGAGDTPRIARPIRYRVAFTIPTKQSLDCYGCRAPSRWSLRPNMFAQPRQTGSIPDYGSPNARNRLGVERCDACKVYESDAMAFLALVKERNQREAEWKSKPVPTTDEEKLAQARPLVQLLGPITMAAAQASTWPTSEFVLAMIRSDTDLVLPPETPSFADMEKFVRLNAKSPANSLEMLWPGYEKVAPVAVQPVVEVPADPVPIPVPPPEEARVAIEAHISEVERGSCHYRIERSGTGITRLRHTDLIVMMRDAANFEEFTDAVRDRLQEGHDVELARDDSDYDDHDGEDTETDVNLTDAASRVLMDFARNHPEDSDHLDI